MMIMVRMSGQVTFSHCPKPGLVLRVPSPSFAQPLALWRRSRRLMILVGARSSLRPTAFVVLAAAAVLWRLKKPMMIASVQRLRQ